MTIIITHRGRVAREAHTPGRPACPIAHISLKFFFHTTTSQRYIGQSPRFRTHREIDWSAGSCGSTRDDALTAPGGVQ